MSQPVWVLSVDLQTKTATFQSGMADAAKSARGAFTDIKSGSGEMGREVGGNMMEARHGVMLLGEEFGVHLPRALSTFIASIGPIGAAMEAAFPFLAIAVGATLLIEHLVKMHEAGEKLTEDQVKFGTAVQTTFNTLDEKIIQAKIRADELRHDHLGALALQLELIDKQSMDELVHSFVEVAKAADVVFADMDSHWYTFGIGSTGAKHALDEFQAKYGALLAQGKDGEASDLLAGTRKSAQNVLDAQKQIAASLKNMDGKSGTDTDDQTKYMQAKNVLQAAGVGYTENEVKAQQALVEALNAQVGIEGKVAELKKNTGSNKKLEDANAGAARQSADARAAAESQLRIGEMVVAADRASANARLAIQHASIQQRMDSDIAFADRELELQMAANAAQIAGLNKTGNDYAAQLKALQDKALELTQQHETAVAEVKSKGQVETANKELTDLQQSEREKIDATQQGSSARLSAIDAALKEEEGRHMQELSSYKQLLTARVETLRTMAQEESKLKADAGREMADNAEKMGELALAAERQQMMLRESAGHVSDQKRVSDETKLANAEYALKMTALSQQMAALDKSGKDYENKLKALQDKEKQLVKQHENDITAIRTKGEEERNGRITSAEARMRDALAQGLTQTLMGHKTFAAMMDSLGEQVVSGMMETAIKSVLANDYTKESDAARAARAMFNAGSKFPFPANIVMAPALGAMAFASVMAFQEGGIVPGVGTGDIVPAKLEPGEGVLPKKLMESIHHGNSGGPTHQYHATTQVHMHVSALDSDGMDKVLNKHAGKLQKHFETTLRKMNH